MIRENIRNLDFNKKRNEQMHFQVFVIGRLPLLLYSLLALCYKVDWVQTTIIRIHFRTIYRREKFISCLKKQFDRV